MITELPDLFQFTTGQRVANAQDWRARRQELLDLILQVEYGQLPPNPGWVKGEELHSRIAERLPNATRRQYRLVTGPDQPYQFLLDLLIPAGDGSFPVILNGDGCCPILTDEIRLQARRALLCTEALGDLWTNPTGT
jgi:hypothetical protein